MRTQSSLLPTATKWHISLLAVLLALLVVGPVAAQNGERITAFHSNIVINTDATLTITETIQLVVTNTWIRQGIFRDFPTIYRDSQGKQYVVGISMQSVQRDGQPEPYRLAKIHNGIRLATGDENTFVQLGRHQYTFTYTVSRALRFLSDHDELYWCVTGNTWPYPIEKATATVVLPGDVPVTRISAYGYTGLKDSAAQDYTAALDPSGSVFYETTRPLAPNERLTVIVKLP